MIHYNKENDIINNKNMFAGFCVYIVLPIILCYFIHTKVSESISKDSTEQISWVEC